MSDEGLQSNMMVVKVWDPGSHGSLARPLVVRQHFYAELHRLNASEEDPAEFSLESVGELVRIMGKNSNIATGEAMHSFTTNELELKVRDEGCNIYAIDDSQLAVMDYMSVDSDAADAYLQGGLDSLFEYCRCLEKILSEPFPSLEEIEGGVFSIMGFLEPYQELYPSLKRVLGDKLAEGFENPDVAKVYLTVADASLAKDYERFRTETVEPWLDILHRVLGAFQRSE